MPDLLIGKTNVTKLIEKQISRQKGQWVFMLEVPEEKYFDVNLETIKVLVNKKRYAGLYISLHRPYRNLTALLEGNGIKINNMYFIDAASSQAEQDAKDLKNISGNIKIPKRIKALKTFKTPNENEKCIHISKELNIDELVKAIYTIIPKIMAKNKFVFLDSITTLALYQPLSETLRFGEFLTRTLKNSEITGVVVNVAETLAQKKFIQEIVMHCDEIIKVK